ncbi:MAG TPA: hypothetical protein VJH96_02695 [Patescibacteria group bacterium]|nr:hypothetical protein [Patescibacteria group bacterium]
MEKTNKSPLTVIIVLVVIVAIVLIFARMRKAPSTTTGPGGQSQSPYDTTSTQSTTNQGATVSTGDPVLDSEIQALDAIINQTNPDDFSDDTLSGIE